MTSTEQRAEDTPGGRVVLVRPSDPAIRVPFPGSSRTLDPAGELVAPSKYWRRRASRGEVVFGTPPEKKKRKPTAPPKE